MTYISFLGIRISEGREHHHYAKSILFSDGFSRELPKRRYQISLNLYNGHAVMFHKKFE